MGALRSGLAELRRQHGFTQESLGSVIGVDRTTIGRIERGETDPFPHTRRELCRALHITTSHLDDLLKPADSGLYLMPDPVPVTPGRYAADHQPTGVLAMYRRDLLRLLTIAGAAVALPPSSEPGLREVQRSADLEHHAVANTSLWQAYSRATTKLTVYPMVQDRLGVLIDQLHNTSSSAAHRRLCTLVCELFQLAGEIFFDADRYGDAAHCYALAASAGREAGAYDQWACALTRQAFVSIYDHRCPDALSILSAADRLASRGDSLLATRDWIAAVRAEAFAGIGDLDGCNRSLDAAEQVSHRSVANSPGGWLRFDGRHLGEERGTCYRTLGQTDLAADALTAVLNERLSLRRQGSVLTDLAAIEIDRRDTDAVLTHARAAVDIAERTRSSGYVGRKLHRLRNQLEPALTDHRLAELNTQISHALAT